MSDQALLCCGGAAYYCMDISFKDEVVMLSQMSPHLLHVVSS